MRKIAFIVAALMLFGGVGWADDCGQIGNLCPWKGDDTGTIGTSTKKYADVHTYELNDTTLSTFGLSILDDANAAALIATMGLGTMSIQDANAVAITGGTINGAVIGGTTPAAADFTDFTSTGTSTLGDGAGDVVIVKGVTLTTAGTALLDDATASDQLTTLGVSTFAKTVLDDVAATNVRDTLELGSSDAVTFDTLTVTTDAEAGAITVTGTSLLSGDVTGDGGDQIMGFLKTVSAKTEEYTITVAESGSWFTNTGDGDGVILNLPAAAAGLWYCFAVDAAQNMDINPDTADQIIAATNAAGDAIRSSTEGDTICLTAISGAKWVTQSSATWADVN